MVPNQLLRVVLVLQDQPVLNPAAAAKAAAVATTMEIVALLHPLDQDQDQTNPIFKMILTMLA